MSEYRNVYLKEPACAKERGGSTNYEGANGRKGPMRKMKGKRKYLKEKGDTCNFMSLLRKTYPVRSVTKSGL